MFWHFINGKSDTTLEMYFSKACMTRVWILLFMTFVITIVNLGFWPDFFASWAKAFGIAYVIELPTIFSWFR